MVRFQIDLTEEESKKLQEIAKKTRKIQKITIRILFKKDD